MRENTMFQKQTTVSVRVLRVTHALFAAALFGGCGQGSDAAPQAADNSAAAYAALTAKLEACDDQHDACSSSATGKSQQAQCDTAANGCESDAKKGADHAKDSLSRDADKCYTNSQDDDAGTSDDAGTGQGEDMDSCVAEHTPRIPKCLKEFVSCLHDARAKSEHGHGHKKPVTALLGCVAKADACIWHELADVRREHHAAKQGHAAGSGGSAGHAGSPSTAGAGGAELGAANIDCGESTTTTTTTTTTVTTTTSAILPGAAP
jgi:hypothetical protein